MLSGQLRDLIAVYSESTTRNSVNEKVKTYTKSFDDRAAINFVSGERQIELGAEMIGKVQKFKVRFALSRYVETMVILWRGDYYLINSIEADARRTYLYITGTRAMPGTITLAT